MRILVRLGELFGAAKLIPIESAHISGVSHKTLEMAPIDFFEALVEANGKMQVPSTVNPSSLDPEYLTKRFPENYLKKQSRVIKLYKKMGVTPTLTCTPLSFPNRFLDQFQKNRSSLFLSDRLSEN